MTDQSNMPTTTQPSERRSAVSVRARSTSDLTTAIRSPDDKREIDAMILERADTALKLGYVPDWTPEERARVLDEFRKALRDLPMWAVKRAFSEWNRTMARKPSPAEIAILAKREMKPIFDEIADRRKAEEREQEARRSE